MSFVRAMPQHLVTAARDLAGIGSTINASNATAAVPTLAVSAAASDQVSAAVASFFSGHAQGYQALSAQAEQFHTQFVQALNAGADTYSSAETANAAPLRHLLNATAATEAGLTGNGDNAKAVTGAGATPGGVLGYDENNARGSGAANQKAGNGGTGGLLGTGASRGRGGSSAAETSAPGGTCGGGAGGLLLRAGVLSGPGCDWSGSSVRAGATAGLLSRLVSTDGDHDSTGGVGRVSGGTGIGVLLAGARDADGSGSSGTIRNRGAGRDAATVFCSGAVGGAGGSAKLVGLWTSAWAGGLRGARRAGSSGGIGGAATASE